MSGIPSQSRFGCYIGNIDRSVTIDMLKQVFCQCGTIIDCSLNGREGDPYRFGFIDFATEDDRARAMKYNGFTLVGRKLKVGISKGNVNKPEGFSTGNPGGVSSPGHNSDRLRRAANPYGEGSSVSGGYGSDGSGGAEGRGGLSTQQQIEARLLLQFLQEGKMDPRQLSPAQQQLLIAFLGQGSGNAGPYSSGGGAMAPMALQPPPQPPVSNPMAIGGGMGGGYGGYGGPNMMLQEHQQQQHYHPQQQQWGAGMPPQGSSNNMSYNTPYPSMPGRYLTPPQQQHMPQPPPPQQQQSPYGANGVAVLGGSGGPSVNAMPTTDTLRLREKQREQYFDVVRREAERYERKVQERKTRAAAGGAERSDSSDDDEDDKPSKKPKKDGA